MEYPLILAVESSCDETAVAIVRSGREIMFNGIATQLERHVPFGGVVPELAARCHLETIFPMLEQAFTESRLEPEAIDLVAATHGPGLIGGLLVGLTAAKGLALAWDKPFIGVNHIEGHIAANFLAHPEITPPFICLTVSGGHTELLYAEDFGVYEILGRTRDDAAGEAFDKVARVLGLGYPGGPAIDRLATKGDPSLQLIREDALAGTYDFSFSGLKTAVINKVHRGTQRNEPLRAADVAASFQRAAVEQLTERTFRAAEERNVHSVLLSGGVAANRELRERFEVQGKASGMNVYYPPMSLCTDNAAMIAAAGYIKARRNGPSPLDLPAVPNLQLNEGF